MTFEEQVYRMYAKTITRGDWETAMFCARRYLGHFVVLLIAVTLVGFVSGCNTDRAAPGSPVSQASLVASPPPAKVVIGVAPGTKFINKDVDVDLVYLGTDPSGAVITDIRVDGSQQYRSIIPDPAQFLESVVKSSHWQRADLVNVKAVQ